MGDAGAEQDDAMGDKALYKDTMRTARGPSEVVRRNLSLGAASYRPALVWLFYPALPRHSHTIPWH